ncbi:NAD(P)-dependent oxidoreductase [Prochlorothrix hollandica]|uniref:Tartronate semialdehyde reductase n=1 Tax=Prochlorothrix hollandica PCC 9006 = CALU 1027 TaxID=317619 RepID=A0A0M2Q152_PROHO|nr:NAD(P)-dependent oxidoreductase [Prochlorothrix hollandica]KKJ01033.1 tartronate semialdehyde reductase [Prochlorothrix hollandica PCC 9006 = CALU 1027]
MNIAVIGLGTMGLPMALNLLQAGYSVTVHNRTRQREAAACDRGAIAADSPQTAAQGAAVIITCVSDSPDVEAVILGDKGIIQGAEPGSVVVDMSTISPEVTRHLAHQLHSRNIAMLDAPVSGGSEGAQKGTLSIMVGGDGAVLERVRPVLSVLGSTITHVGAIGSGQLTKAINQIIVAGTYWAVAEGLALGLKAGLDMDQVVQAVGGGAAGSWGLSHRSGHMIANDYPLGFRLRLHRKDLNIALAAARELGVVLPVSAYVEQMETGLIQQGYGDEDVSALARSIRQQSGL